MLKADFLMMWDIKSRISSHNSDTSVSQVSLKMKTNGRNLGLVFTKMAAMLIYGKNLKKSFPTELIVL